MFWKEETVKSRRRWFTVSLIRFALGALLVAMTLSYLALGEPAPARTVRPYGGAPGSASTGGDSGRPSADPVALPAGSGGSASTTEAGLSTGAPQWLSEPPRLPNASEQ